MSNLRYMQKEMQSRKKHTCSNGSNELNLMRPPGPHISANAIFSRRNELVCINQTEVSYPNANPNQIPNNASKYVSYDT